MNTSLPTMIRTLELAKATSLQGHQVTLSFMHPAFNPPVFFYDVIKTFKSERLDIRYRSNLDSRKIKYGTPGKITECKPRLVGLIRQIISSLRYIPVELKLLKEIRPDVIIARPDHIISFVFTAKYLGVPLILETDGPIEELDHFWGISSKWLRYIDLIRGKSADAILYISNVCGQLWQNKMVPEERLFLCPNGADPYVFKPLFSHEREKLRIQYGLQGSIVIGFSGNQRRWHGIDHLLKSVVPLMKQNPLIKIFIIGTIEDKQSLGLNSLPNEIVDRQVIFTGPVNYLEMPKIIDLSDIIVMPYPQMELFHFSPMKMFEAMSLGKIIIAPRQGQIADILSNLDSVFLYEPNQEDALLNAIKQGLEAVSNGVDGMRGRELLIREHSWTTRGRVIGDACRYALKARVG